MHTNKAYFALLQIADDGVWYPQFGDHSRAVVAQELVDMADSERLPRRRFRIVRCENVTQGALDAAVREVNA